MLGLSRGRPSRIDMLPDDLKENLHALLRDKRITQKEILEIVNPVIMAQQVIRTLGECVQVFQGRVQVSPVKCSGLAAP